MPDDSPLQGPVFIAVGEDGLRMFSRDGRDWTNRTTGKEGEIFSTACFTSGRCLVGGRYGGENQFRTTGDGVAWLSSKYDAQYTTYVRLLIPHDGKFHALIGDNSGATRPPAFITTEDGVNWSKPQPITLPNKDQRANALLRRYAQGNGLIVAVGDYGRRSVSPDLINWQNTPNAKPVDTLIDVAFGNGLFVGGGMHGLRMISSDGLTWTDRVTGEEGEHINCMIFDGKQFVGIGQGATYISADGKAWQRTPNQNAPTSAAFGAGVYVGSLWPGRMLRSIDGILWEEIVKVPQHANGFSYGVLGA